MMYVIYESNLDQYINLTEMVPYWNDLNGTGYLFGDPYLDYITGVLEAHRDLSSPSIFSEEVRKMLCQVVGLLTQTGKLMRESSSTWFIAFRDGELDFAYNAIKVDLHLPKPVSITMEMEMP